MISNNDGFLLFEIVGGSCEKCYRVNWQIVILITVMALYDLHAYKTVIKINILHVYSMKKGSDVLGSWFRRFGILKRRIGQTLELPYGGLKFVTFVYGIHNIWFFGTHWITRTQACVYGLVCECYFRIRYSNPNMESGPGLYNQLLYI